MPKRVMTILADMAPKQEVYSIDECFLDLTGVPALREHGQAMRKRIRQWTGLPVCVGIAASKTLAKLANHVAKKQPQFDSVCDFGGFSAIELDAMLGSLEAGDVWGIGRRLTPRLEQLGIRSVRDLRDADTALIRSTFGVVLERTVHELRGESCLAMEDEAPARKQIMSSRSFGVEVTTFEELRESLLTYVARAAEKLRHDGSVASAVTVFVQTNEHKNVAQHNARMVVPLPQASDDTVLVGQAAVSGLRSIYRKGFRYKKTGILLMDLMPKAQRQASLFEDAEQLKKRDRFNRAMDSINAKYGRSTVSLAGLASTSAGR